MPSDARAVIQYGIINYQNNCYKNAAVIFKEVLATGITDPMILYEIYYFLGNIKVLLKNYTRALIYNHKCLELAKLANRTDLEIISRGDLTETLTYLERFEEALTECDLHFQLAQEKKITNEIIKGCFYKAFIVFRKAMTEPEINDSVKSQLVIAQNLMKQTITCVEYNNNHFLQMLIIGTYSLIHSVHENFQEALDLMTQKLEICKIFSDKPSLRRTYLIRARIHLKMNNLSKAIDDCKSALSICKDISDPSCQIDSLYVLANTYFICKKFKSSLETMRKYLKVANDDAMLQAEAYYYLAIINVELGDKKSVYNFVLKIFKLAENMKDEKHVKDLNDCVRQINNYDNFKAGNKSYKTNRNLDNIFKGKPEMKSFKNCEVIINNEECLETRFLLKGIRLFNLKRKVKAF